MSTITGGPVGTPPTPSESTMSLSSVSTSTMAFQWSARISFFERVPQGCDAYMMKHIIHDWSDEHCRTVLKLFRAQLPPHGRLLVCELVMPEAPGPAPAKMLDIEMLVMTVGGRERSREEFADLFASAGLRLEKIVTTPGPICVIEARPA